MINPCMKACAIASRIYGEFPCSSVLLAAVAICALSSCSAPDGSPDALYERDLSDGIHDTSPVYPLKGTLSLHRDGDAYECTMCHDEYRKETSFAAQQVEHADIEFAHGLNDHCLHCHNPKAPDVFIDHDGTEIPGDLSTMLCAKCHGTTYRDWGIGIHGREDGYWDRARGPAVKLTCIECHDPHAPKFPLMRPDPPPAISRFQTRRETPADE